MINTEAAPALLRTVLSLNFVENSQDLSKSHREDTQHLLLSRKTSI